MHLLSRTVLVSQLAILPRNLRFLSDRKRYPRTQAQNVKKTQASEQISASNNGTDSFAWGKMRNALLKEKKCNLVNVDTSILNFCKKSKDPVQNALSYADYLKKHNLLIDERNIDNQLLKLFVSQVFNGVNVNQAANDSNILRRCNQILEDPSKLKHRLTYDLLLNAISMTHEWTKVLSLIDKHNTICSHSNLPAFSMVAANAFLHKNPEVGWSYLEQIINSKLNPNCIAFLMYWTYCEPNTQDFILNIEKMLFFLKQNEIITSKAVLNGLGESLAKNGLSLSWTTISPDRSQCLRCNNKLETPSVTLAQFNKLRKEFIEVYVNKNELGNYSSSSEMNRFRQYVNKKNTFDIIIDGLNTAMAMSDGNVLKQAKKLSAVLKECIHGKKRVLIIGRKHMEQWPAIQMNFIQKHSTLFLTGNESDDDLYVLYATLASGPAANLISLDRFEEYPQKLSIESSNVFKLWQKEHQFSAEYSNQTNTIEIKKLSQTLFYAQKINTHWHVPYIETSNFKRQQPETLISYACLETM